MSRFVTAKWLLWMPLLAAAVAALAFMAFMSNASAAGKTVGYYEMCDGEGRANQVAPIIAAGETAVKLFNLTAADLVGIDVAFVDNCSSGGYGSEFRANVANVETWVSEGGVFIIHDRYVAGSATILPGGSSFSATGSFSSTIDVQDDTATATNGPGGVVTDTTLDGGNYSNHGMVTRASVGAGTFILNVGVTDQMVTFSYPFGSGYVVYSTIPLDFYLSRDTNFKTIYAPNVIAYGASPSSPPDTPSPVIMHIETGTERKND